MPQDWEMTIEIRPRQNNGAFICFFHSPSFSCLAFLSLSNRDSFEVSLGLSLSFLTAECGEDVSYHPCHALRANARTLVTHYHSQA